METGTRCVHNSRIQDFVFDSHDEAEEAVLNASLCVIRRSHSSGTETFLSTFRSVFGVTPELCAQLWFRVFPAAPVGANPKHLLWALKFLRGYDREAANAACVGVHDRTYRKWQWIFVRALASLQTVRSDHDNQVA